MLCAEIGISLGQGLAQKTIFVLRPALAGHTHLFVRRLTRRHA
jgi:hypothetical protein